MPPFIVKFDKVILDGHQWVVDTTQRKGQWLAEQAVYVMVILFAIRCYFETPTPLAIALTMAMYAFIWWYVRTTTPDEFEKVSWFRIMFAFFPFIDLIFFLKPGATPSDWIRFLSDFAWMTIYYFLSCHPPRPRVPKTKLVPSL